MLKLQQSQAPATIVLTDICLFEEIAAYLNVEEINNLLFACRDIAKLRDMYPKRIARLENVFLTRIAQYCNAEPTPLPQAPAHITAHITAHMLTALPPPPPPPAPVHAPRLISTVEDDSEDDTDNKYLMQHMPETQSTTLSETCKQLINDEYGILADKFMPDDIDYMINCGDDSVSFTNNEINANDAANAVSDYMHFCAITMARS